MSIPGGALLCFAQDLEGTLPMKLTFRVFGIEVTTLELDIPDSVSVEQVVPTLASKGAKWLSARWIKAMLSN